MSNIRIFNEDCIKGSRRLEEGSVGLMLCDPPFGINEGQFDKHYNRKSDNVLSGYTEAPSNYAEWTLDWMSEAVRVLKPDGCFYIIMGHSNLRHVLNAAAAIDLHEVNHAIWKFNFGVATKSKFVTSHYHIMYYAKSKKASPVFNTQCRFGSQDRDENNGSLLYQDLEDVFSINKEYSPGETKNQNKLPEELIRKLILYSSNAGDVVCDFFMGSLTTETVALKLGRDVCGFEINKESYDHHIPLLEEIEYGCDLGTLREIYDDNPERQGKSFDKEEVESIYADYRTMILKGKSNKEASEYLQDKYKRGRFSIQNLLERLLSDRPIEISNTLGF